MLKSRYLPLIAMPLLWSFAAAAQPPAEESHASVPDVAQVQSWHKDMCSERYGHEVGHLAALESRLALTDQQRPLWDAWSKGVAKSATGQRDQCLADVPATATPPSAVEAEARMERELSARLQSLQANHAALQKLYQALSSDQQKVFDHSFRPHPHHPPMEFGHGPMRG